MQERWQKCWPPLFRIDECYKLHIICNMAFASEDTHRRIAQATVQVFLQGGVRTLTGEAVAKVAGVSRMTVYRHFLSKRDLVRAALNGIANVFRQALDHQSTGGFVVTTDRLTEAVGGLPAGGLPTRLDEVRNRYPELYEEFLVARRQGVDELLQRFFADARATGCLRKDLDRHIVEAVVREATAGVLTNPLLWEKGRGPAELFRTIKETILYGLLRRMSGNQKEKKQ